MCEKGADFEKKKIFYCKFTIGMSCKDRVYLSGVPQCTKIGSCPSRYIVTIEIPKNVKKVVQCTPCKDKDIEINALKRQLYNIKDLCSQGIK